MRHPVLLLALLAACAARASEIAAVPMDDGHAVRQVVDVRPFTLAEGSVTYDFRAGAPSIRAGHLAVLRVDPRFLRPVQVKAPVLYVGPVPLQLAEKDVASGCVVGLVPPDVDPGREPFFVGSYELPERVDAARGAAERRAAVAAGLQVRPATEQSTWSGAPIAARDPAALQTAAHDALVRCTTATRGVGPVLP